MCVFQVLLFFFTCVRADVDLQGTVTAKDLLTQATLVAEKGVVADILGSFNHCNKNKKPNESSVILVHISWQNYLLFQSFSLFFFSAMRYISRDV